MIFGGFRPTKQQVQRNCSSEESRKFNNRVYAVVLEEEQRDSRDLLEACWEENPSSRKKSERMLDETSEEENELNFEELLQREKTPQQK